MQIYFMLKILVVPTILIVAVLYVLISKWIGKKKNTL